MPSQTLDASASLPFDWRDSTLVGRVWDPAVNGPSPVVVRPEGVVDLTGSVATVREISEHASPAEFVRATRGRILGSIEEILANTPRDTRRLDRPWFLSPVDVHAVKAAGVTFPVSMIERTIEERGGGDPVAAATIRAEILGVLGGSLRGLRPGTEPALDLKRLLVSRGWWSQYLEVGIGPDAEVFTKSQVLSTVGTGVEVGISASSVWNNPEPEIVLVVSSRGRVVGATLGNDVNLRDIEGRSALLLPKAKDNNASAALGPFVRLFDGGYGIDHVRSATVQLTIAGADGFLLEQDSRMDEISRDPLDLVEQVTREHAYPDGFVLYLGTMFAPVDDRDAVGLGFTHHIDDVVRISEPALGTLVNRVALSADTEPWSMGADAFYRNLAARGLLARKEAATI